MPYTEKRRFYRIQSERAIEYSDCSDQSAGNSVSAKSADISQAGIAFTTNKPPAVSSLIWIQLEISDLNICEEIEKQVLITDKGLLGRVVHIKELEVNSVYQVGVSFVRKDDPEANA